MWAGNLETFLTIKCSASSWASEFKQASSHCPAGFSYSSCSRTDRFPLLKQAGFSVTERKNMSYLDFYNFSISQEVGKGKEEKKNKYLSIDELELCCM